MENHKLYINVKENKLILVTLNEEGLEVNRTSYDIRNSDGSVNKVAFNVMEMVKQELGNRKVVNEQSNQEKVVDEQEETIESENSISNANTQEQDVEKQEETLEDKESTENPIKYPYHGEEFEEKPRDFSQNDESIVRFPEFGDNHEETLEDKNSISEANTQEQDVEKQEETLENKDLNRFEIIDEYKPDNAKKLSTKGKVLLGLIFVGGLALAVSKFESCSTKEPVTIENTIDNENENNIVKEIPVASVEETTTSVEAPVEEIPTIEELKSESRYTEITEENVALATKNLIDEFNKNGIEVTSEDALTFVTVANMTHFEQTNQELLSQVLGMDANKEATLSKVGHIIGQVVTLEITDKDQQVDWTKALLNETDKKIAVNAMETVEYCKEIASNQELTEEEKATQIQDEIQERFVKPNYDKTEGYNFSDGTHSALSQEDGADFVTDAIFTGIVLGDNVIKNYVYGSETMDDMMAISGNEDVVSNLMTMIENCKQVEETNQMSR